MVNCNPLAVHLPAITACRGTPRFTGEHNKALLEVSARFAPSANSTSVLCYNLVSRLYSTLSPPETIPFDVYRLWHDMSSRSIQFVVLAFSVLLRMKDASAQTTNATCLPDFSWVCVLESSLNRMS